MSRPDTAADHPVFELGAVMPSPAPSPEHQRRLALRRSAPAQTLAAPGPSPEQMEQILTLGARSPDHGKLFPWRFVVMGPHSRAGLADQLTTLATRKALPAKAIAVLAKLTAAPVSVLVVSTARPGPKPVWEQELSAGAVCMNLEHAADALGYSASWITDWYSYDDDARPLLGLAAGERVAGFIHIGTATDPLLERDRPNLATLTTTLP